MDIFKFDLGPCIGRYYLKIAFLYLIDSWVGVVRFMLLETDSVHHDPTSDVPTDYLAFVV